MFKLPFGGNSWPWSESDTYQAMQLADGAGDHAHDFDTPEPSMLDYRQSNRGADNKKLDIVQFSANCFIVDETAGVMRMKVMRIGSLEDKCSVSFKTKDASATGNVQYKATQGSLVFQHGESSLVIMVELIAQTHFDTTLSFMLELYDPTNCRVDATLWKIPIYLLDPVVFPSDALKPVLESSDKDLLFESGTLLLYEFFKYIFWCVPQVWWKSILLLCVDQTHNAYYLTSIFMRVYLVDGILNENNSADNLLIPGNRTLSALTLAFAWTIPNFFLTLLDRSVVKKLDVGFAIRKHLRVNVFRKFLNLSDASRREVRVDDLTSLQANAIPQLARDGYLGIFDMIRHMGKISCVGIFIIHTHPYNALPLVVFPLVLVLYMHCTQAEQIRLSAKAAEQVRESQGVLAQACDSFDVIRNYEQKEPIIHTYEHLLNTQREMTLELKIREFWNAELVPWMTVIAVGTYMGFGAIAVLDGLLTIGTFLATLHVYKDLGDRFDGLHDKMNSAKEAIEPLLELTELLNMKTELPDLMKASAKRMEMTEANMADFEKEAKGMSRKNWALIPIRFSRVHLGEYSHIQDFSAEVKLSSIVCVFGHEGCGKAGLLKVISGRTHPRMGSVFYTPHQVPLQVGCSPEIIGYLDLLDNLRFGAHAEHRDPKRVRRIFQAVSDFPDDHWLMKMLDTDIGKDKFHSECFDDDEVHNDRWVESLSRTQKKMIHIARAFIYDPQILVMHTPLDDLETTVATRILEQLVAFVGRECTYKKQRTVFLSAGTVHKRDLISPHAMYQWDLNEGTFRSRVGSPDNPMQGGADNLQVIQEGRDLLNLKESPRSSMDIVNGHQNAVREGSGPTSSSVGSYGSPFLGQGAEFQPLLGQSGRRNELAEEPSGEFFLSSALIPGPTNY